MRGLVAHIMPDRLAAQFALLLVGALLAANIAALILLSTERTRLGQEAAEDQEIERIIALVPALEAVAPHLRYEIARDASTPVARVAVGRRSLITVTRPDRRSRIMAERLGDALGARPVRVAIATHGPGGVMPRHDPMARDSDFGREIIAISIQLNVEGPESWLNVATRGGFGKGRTVEGRVIVVILGLSLLAVLGVGMIFLRHLTRPLTGLAAAARAAGHGDHAARVPESGAREMREVAIAFNTMQAQIARFDAERMRTMAALGHDLRTPITSLRIRAEMLDDDMRLPMVRTLDEMTVMADGLVAYARGDGEVENRQSVDLAGLLTQLCEDRGAELELAMPVTVSGRPVALGRALGNLIDNAIRYGNGARVRLSHDEGGVVIDVDDDGPGIPDERLASVFEPFVRGDDSRSAETGGAGLGLSIARSIIRGHGGTIDLANREGGGLRARVRLPVEKAGKRGG